MEEENNPQPVSDNTEETTTETVTEETKPISIPKSRFDEVNKERKELQAKLAEIEKKQAEEQGNYKELATKYETELNELKNSYKQAKIQSAVTLEASRYNPQDINVVMKFIEQDSILDETGEVNTQALSSEFTRIKTEMPYLFKDSKIQNAGNSSGGNPEKSNSPIFKESQLKDSDFVAKNIKQITEAQKEGRILIGQ
jgi:predicted nuclease with TOPRIM domain